MKHIVRTYEAQPTLALFHASSAFYRGVMGPVGSGKSTAMCMEIMRRARQQEPGQDGIRRSRFLVVRNTYPELRDTTVKTWLDWFDESSHGHFDRTGMNHKIRIGDVHTEIMFRALDRPGDVKKVLSLELTGAWINEAREVPKSLVDAVGDRVERFPAARDGGCTWAGVIMDTNPSDTDHWWHRLAEDETPGQWAFFRQPGGLIERDGSFHANPMAENLNNLPPDYYLRRMHGKSPDHLRVYYCGRYGAVMDGRAVYPEFSRGVHVASENLNPVPGLPVYIGLDFGLTPAAVFGQRLSSGRWQWMHELTATDMGMTRFAEMLGAELRGRYRDHKCMVFGDPAGVQRSQVDERTPFDILRARGVDARPAPSNDPIIRREAVAQALSRLVMGKPGLMVSPSCSMLIKGMAGGYSYRRVRMAGEDRFRDAPDKNKFSHVCDAAQYLMLGAGEGREVVRALDQEADRPDRTVNDYNPFGEAS